MWYIRGNYDILYDMKNFKITNYRIKVDKSRFRLQQPIRFAMLSDLHNCIYGTDNEGLVQAVKEMQPDIIMIAGDMVTADLNGNDAAAVSLLRRLAEIVPVYYGNGNHEYEMKMNTRRFGTRYLRYSHNLKEAGIHLLENKSIIREIHGLKMNISAFELPQSYYRRIVLEKLRAADIKERLGTVSRDIFQVLIAHNPVWFRAYAIWGADLTFSGHLHGGYLRLPRLGGVLSPQFSLFPKYDKGLFDQGRHHLVVGAGIGTHGFIPRINNPPELVMVELH